MDKNKARGIALVIGASLCYGLMPSITQLSYKAGLSIETMLSDRYIIAFLITWAYILMSGIDYRISMKQKFFLLAVGVVYIGVAMFVNMSYLYLPGALTSILVFMYVSIVVLMELVSGREKLRAIKLFCVALSLAGLILVVWDPSGAGTANIFGILLALGAGTCYAIYAFAIGGKITENIDTMVVIGYIMILPTIFYFVNCWQSGESLFPASASQATYILLLAVFSTFLGGIMFYRAVRLIGSGNASIINTIEPVIAYFAGMILMGDVLDYMTILGGCIIMSAIILLNMEGRTKERVFIER